MKQNLTKKLFKFTITQIEPKSSNPYSDSFYLTFAIKAITPEEIGLRAYKRCKIKRSPVLLILNTHQLCFNQHPQIKLLTVSFLNKLKVSFLIFFFFNRHSQFHILFTTGTGLHFISHKKVK